MIAIPNFTSAMTPADEKVTARVAWIFGPQSTSAKSLAELKRRRMAGEIVGLFRSKQYLIVGPATARVAISEQSGEVLIDIGATSPGVRRAGR